MASNAFEWIGGLSHYGPTSHFRPGICGVKPWTKKEILAHLAARGMQWQWRVWIVNQACHLLVNWENLSSLCMQLNCVIRIFNCFPKSQGKLDSWSIRFSWTVSLTLGKQQLIGYYLKTIKWCEHLPKWDCFSPVQPKSVFLKGCFTRATHSPGAQVFSVVMSVLNDQIEASFLPFFSTKKQLWLFPIKSGEIFLKDYTQRQEKSVVHTASHLSENLTLGNKSCLLSWEQKAVWDNLLWWFKIHYPFHKYLLNAYYGSSRQWSPGCGDCQTKLGLLKKKNPSQ